MSKINILLVAFALSISFLFVNGCGNKADSLKWYDNLNSAMKVAQKQNKPIFVDFTGSDWCKWCKRLNKEVFSQDDFINYAKNNLVLVKIDFPEHIKQSAQTIFYNRQLAQRFGVEGYPTIVLLDKRGYIIAKTGFQYGGAEAYVQHIKSLL